MPFVDLGRAHAPLATELHEAFDRVLGSSGFVLGEEVECFEHEWAAANGVAHCVGVASGTAAIELALRAAGVGAGDEVVVPAHTFIASALGVLHAGAVPVLCDVEEATGLIDVEAAADAIGPRTAAVLAVHLYGRPCDVDALQKLADRHGIALIADAAQAHGARHRDRPVGGLGLASCFSFYPTKNLGALGDGGAICTNDAALAEAARRARNLGQRAKGEHLAPGRNERLHGLQAALLRVKLRHLDEANAARVRHAALYRSRLDGGVGLPEEAPEAPSVHHLFPVRHPDRDALARRLAQDGIATQVHYTPALAGQPALQGRLGRSSECPRAASWAREELSLPMFAELRPAEVHRVADAVLGAVALQEVA